MGAESFGAEGVSALAVLNTSVTGNEDYTLRTGYTIHRARTILATMKGELPIVNYVYNVSLDELALFKQQLKGMNYHMELFDNGTLVIQLNKHIADLLHQVSKYKFWDVELRCSKRKRVTFCNYLIEINNKRYLLAKLGAKMTYDTYTGILLSMEGNTIYYNDIFENLGISKISPMVKMIIVDTNIPLEKEKIGEEAKPPDIFPNMLLVMLSILISVVIGVLLYLYRLKRT